MAFDRDLRNEIISRHNIPKYPCPHCPGGRLRAESETVRVEEPQYSRAQHEHEAWEPEWTIERFLLLLRCDNESCGEVVTAHGDTRVVEYEDDEHGWVTLTALRPRS